MKLQTRTTLNYIVVSTFIYVIVAVSFYVAVQYVIYEEVDRRLLVEKGDFEHFVDRSGYWESDSYFVEDKIRVHATSISSPVEFKDTLLLGRYASQFVPFRQISFDKEISGKNYRVSIRKSLIEFNYLLSVITIVMLVVLCAGFSLLYVFQRRTSKRLWQPFYEALAKATDFNVHHGDKLVLPKQKIDEFNDLNAALNKMTEKILSDYQNLREFTENASHEIQTPLAAISTRVEGLIQDPSISAKHIQWIQDIHESAMRLSRLNHALLILTKIDNGQFQDADLVDLNRVVRKHVDEMEELIAFKEINLRVEESESFTARVNHSLADMLVSNLLKNAVKHNLPSGGSIEIAISSTSLRFVNPGAPLTVPPRKLFERFQKQDKSTGSLGLGLAIVKKICEISDLDLDYEYSNGLHSISVTKSSS